MRPFRIHSFNNFFIYHTAALAIVVTLYLVSSVYIETGSLYVLTTLEHIFSNWLNKLESLAQVEEEAHFMWRESVQKEIM